jgi:gliding motility-associated-like protein
MLCCSCLLTATGASQCSVSISTFPAIENFEIGQGNWSSGGTNSSWAFGMPNKQIISNAASGINCWTTGGLSGNGYNNAENSWLQSPCYNFSSLTNPQISMKLFWETEKKYDGASFQYSLDGAITWQTLGSSADNTNCTGINWFNTSPVTSLGKEGWSGNIQATSPCIGGAGGGSGAWVTAKHSLSALAGKPTVIFRFVFAAGTQCNAYDGFAVDDIVISETPNATADFVFACSNSNTVAFTSTSSLCATSYAWDFGEPTSTTNTSTHENPVHVYAASGTYQVQLVVTYTGGLVVTKNKTITVLNVTPVVTTPIACNGDVNGKLTANVAGGSGNYNYYWNTAVPQTTQSINNLSAGFYTVIVSANNACTTVASIQLPQPTALNVTAITKDAFCGKAGKLEVNVIGGVAPYQYNWSNGSTSSMQTNVAAGIYSVQVKDVNGCNKQLSNLVIKDSIKQVKMSLGKDTSFCPGGFAILRPGSFVSYLWQDNSVADTFLVTQTGNYYVTVTDADGCTKTDTISVNVDCTDVYFPSAFTPNRDGRNDFFGPIGNLYALSKFSMSVYGRWGQLIFYTTNPFNKWDGKINGIDADQGTFVWFASYSINSKPMQTKKGTIILLR